MQSAPINLLWILLRPRAASQTASALPPRYLPRVLKAPLDITSRQIEKLPANQGREYKWLQHPQR